MDTHAHSLRFGRGALLSFILFFAVFLNGFEAGGYQACLLAVGKEFELTNSLLGLLAAVQLIATLIAPLIFGPIADRHGKKPMLDVFLALKIAACAVVFWALSATMFAVGIFFVGFCVAIIQYTAIAALSDAFPVSGKKKIGLITSAYSLGAVVAPLACSALFSAGGNWRGFFIALLVLTVLVLVAMRFDDFSPKELQPTDLSKGSGVDVERKKDIFATTGDVSSVGASWSAIGIFMLCLIMFIYVGVENGFAFFLNSFMQQTLGAADGSPALSLFWFAMIPSRILCGAWATKRRILLVVATVGVTAFSLAMACMQTPLAATALSFVLGWFSGMVYPNVLSFSVDFCGGRSATATGRITAATGFGGAVVSASFGFIADACGMRAAFVVLAAIMAIDIIAAFYVLALSRRCEQR